MKLKLNFTPKISKLAIKYELIFVNNKNFKHKILNLNEFINSDLFKEKKIILRNHGGNNYILINCIDHKKPTEFENLGSEIFDFLLNNKIRNSYFALNKIKISSLQIERILHGANLKSYCFDIY